MAAHDGAQFAGLGARVRILPCHARRLQRAAHPPRPHITLLSNLRLAGALILVLLLSACAEPEVIRGRLTYDLRPETQRSTVVLPRPPNPPRYRDVGQLVGYVQWAGGRVPVYRPEHLTAPARG